MSTATRPAPARRSREDARAGRPAWLGARLRQDQRWAVGLVVALAGLWGLTAAWWTPRGPLTVTEDLTTIAVSTAVGVGAGWLLRSRWAYLLTPLAFVVVLEIARSGLDGFTVDMPVATGMGAIAFAVGRGVHGLVALLPMVIGIAIGRALTGDHGSSTVRRWILPTILTVVLVGLVVVVARPPRTAPILGPDGEPLAGSVAELTRIDVGDHELAAMVRGRDVTNPVLLFLAGGPGGSELGAMRRHGQALEEDFVVVTLDERGAGHSYDQLDPTSAITLDGAVADVLAVTDHLRERFGTDRVVLVGNSWGTLPGAMAVARHPERFHAFVGTGQMVSPSETDQIFYADTLAWARERDAQDLVDTLVEAGPPPYADLRRLEPVLAHEHDVYAYDETGNDEPSAGFTTNLMVEEYSALGSLRAVGAMLDTFSVLYPQIQAVDLRVDVPRLDVPVYIVQGGNEARGRAEPLAEWVETLDAPRIELITFETAGHRPLFQQPAAFAEVMRGVVDDVVAQG